MISGCKTAERYIFPWPLLALFVLALGCSEPVETYIPPSVIVGNEYPYPLPDGIEVLFYFELDGTEFSCFEYDNVTALDLLLEWKLCVEPGTIDQLRVNKSEVPKEIFSKPLVVSSHQAVQENWRDLNGDNISHIFYRRMCPIALMLGLTDPEKEFS